MARVLGDIVATRKDPGLASLPVIVCSASVHGEARESVDELGCEAFIEKPVDFDVLYATLEQLLTTST